MPKLAHVTTSDISLALLLGNQLRAYREAGFEPTGISAAGAWGADLQAQGIPHLEISALRRSWAPAADARAFYDLVRLFRRHRFDIVHTHNPKTGVLGRIAARVAGTPVVVNTVHGLYGTDGGAARRRMYLTMERIAAACSDYEFCQSREDLELLRALKIVSPDRSSYIGNGVDLTIFDPAAVDRRAVRTSLGIDDATVVVGAVGRLVWEKGLRELFEAAERIRADTPNVRFIAVGPRDEDKSDAVPQATLTELERRGIMQFLGLRRDVRDLYAAMDVFVLASYREGFPRSAVEAAAMRLPLVLTDIRGCREVVEVGQNGFLVPPRDVSSLEGALQRLIADAHMRQRFGDASRTKALDAFDERRIIGQILDVYRMLMAEKPGRVVSNGHIHIDQKSVDDR